MAREFEVAEPGFDEHGLRELRDLAGFQTIDGEKGMLFDQFLETSWEAFEGLLGKLPIRKQWEMRRFITAGMEMGLPQRYLASWGGIIRRVIEFRRDGKNLTPSHDLNETEARVAIMVSNYPYLLTVLGENTTPAGFTIAMGALRATLPWNRTGWNAYTPATTDVSDLFEAVSYVKTLASKYLYVFPYGEAYGIPGRGWVSAEMAGYPENV